MAEAIIGKINKPNKPELIYDPEYRHPLVASSYTGHTSLLSNVTGKPMLTQYYRSIQGDSTEPMGFQPDSIETYQSYTCIKGLIIKIDEEIASNWDGEWSTIGQEGIGYVLFDLAPVPHDVFIADIGDGRAGLFQLYDEPRIRRVAMDKVYEIQIRLIAIVNQQIEDNLNKKTINTLAYSKDSAIRGGNAVLTVGDYDANKTLAQLETVIIQDHLAEFYYEPEKTIIIPIDDNKLTYDPYLTKFLSYIFTSNKMGMREPITNIGVSFGKSQVGGTKLTVWDMFYQENYSNPSRYHQNYYLHNATDLLNTRYYGGIYYSKLDQAILTEEYGASKDGYRFYNSLLFDEFIPSYNDAYEDTPQGGKKGQDHMYFFSDDFYKGNSTKENEAFIFHFFRDKTIDKKALIKILNEYWNLSPMARCYMAGIYVAAIRISLSSTYNYL